MLAREDARSRSAERTWALLTTRFTSEFDELTDAIAHRLIAELPSFGDVLPADMVEIARRGMGALIPAVREHRPLTRREFEVYRATTEAQAVQGVLLDDMLQAWHVGFDAMRNWGREKSLDAGPASADILLDFLDIVIPWYDGGMATSVDWYRASAHRAFLANATERAAFVRRVLGGGVETAELTTRARLFGLPLTSTYHALRAPARSEAALGAVSSWLGLSETARRPSGIVAVVDGDVWGFVDHLPVEPFDIAVGVSEPVPLLELPSAFRLATRAMDTAVALGLSGRHDIRSLGVHVAVVEDHGVGTSLLEQYVHPLEELGQPGVEILNTVRSFLDNQGHYERTGTQLFVHPNTVRYRIKRYEEIVGTSLRDTATMVGIWWALERRRVG